MCLSRQQGQICRAWRQAGFPLVKAFTEVKDTAWVDYKWPDPIDNNKIKDKSSYVIHTGDYFVGVGYYKS
jgi:hypothetical protein